MVINFCVLGNSGSPLHDADGIIIIPATLSECVSLHQLKGNPLMAHFHFSPLAPDLSKVLDILEIDLGSLLKHLAGTCQVCFRFA